MKQFLKHLLVLFTDFKNFGPLICVGIPLFLYTLITIKKRKRWEIALLFISVLSFFILSLGGVGYVRYILTLYPVIIGALVYYGWQLVRKRNIILKLFAFLILFILIGINYAQHSEYYRFYWRYKVVGSENYFPEKLLDFIHNIQDFEPGEKILIYSRWHLFYYHVDKNGLDFRNPEVNQFYIQEEKSSALDVLRNKIKIKYILVQRNMTAEWPLTEPFSEILLYDCDLLIQENGLELFRLRDGSLDRKDLERYFVNESLIQNGSFERIANELDLDIDQFKKDMQSSKLVNHLRGDMIEAQQNGITSTPSIYINGRKLKKRSMSGFQELIDEELNKLNM